MSEDIPKIEFEVGQTYRACFGVGTGYKIHIVQVIPTVYDDHFVIVYRYFGKHKQYWHYELRDKKMLEMYIDFAAKRKNIEMSKN